MTSIARALDHVLRAIGDPVADLAAIGPGDARSAVANSIRAGVGVLAKVPGASAAIAQAVRESDRPGVAPRLRAHFAAARAWVAGEPDDAAHAYAAIVRRWPRDLLALRLAISCNFFLGDVERNCDLADEALLAWHPGSRGHDFVLAMACFAQAEAGHWQQAEALGRRALARNPRCPMGVHAVAHALAQSGDARRGARWMRAQRAHWAVHSRMLTHNAWHLALFDLDAGDTASAIAIADGCLLPAARTSPVDACDAAALLARIEREGPAMGARWNALSDAFVRIWQPGFWPYVDLHAALVHAHAGRADRLRQLADGVQRRAREHDGIARRARAVTLPALRGIGPVQGMGGSRVQVALLESMSRHAGSGMGTTNRHAGRRIAGGRHGDDHSAAH
jgi:hypothetical protein